jgi:hypothetical protein
MSRRYIVPVRRRGEGSSLVVDAQSSKLRHLLVAHSKETNYVIPQPPESTSLKIAAEVLKVPAEYSYRGKGMSDGLEYRASFTTPVYSYMAFIFRRVLSSRHRFRSSGKARANLNSQQSYMHFSAACPRRNLTTCTCLPRS